MKNALDWLVGGEEFIGKPVALHNASPRATLAQASLMETITVMSGRIVPEASITVPLLGLNLDEAGIVSHPEIASVLHAAIAEECARTLRAIEQSSRISPADVGTPAPSERRPHKASAHLGIIHF